MASSFYLTALAAAGGEAPQSPDQQLLDVDGTAFVMLALFGLVAFILTKWLWRPYLRIREERVTRVDGYREDAQKLEAEAASRLLKVEAELADARRQGSLEAARMRLEAQAHETRIVSEAQAAANKALADARARVETTLAGERVKLQDTAVALGREITERVLGRGVAS